ncbi:putative ring-cleaving dioxygenase [Gorgonomyces haynaldii]|nr:putative ring-cleaving dioxygenase [Gorgonomyces haynaldii]
MQRILPFHHAFPCISLSETTQFYQKLGCTLGRTDPGKWVDFNLFGHQIVAHQIPKDKINAFREYQQSLGSMVDSHKVPIPHFGCVLEWNQYHEFVDRIKPFVKFELEPMIRFKGLPGEQATMFFRDPSGNALEFKSFKSLDSLFDAGK